MKTINGITVPGELYAEATSLNAAGTRIFLETPENISDFNEPPSMGCANCGGSGTIILSWVNNGPFIVPPTGGHVQQVDDMWYTGGRKTYPCPICRVSDLHMVRRALAEDCGLTEEEFEYRLDFIEGMEGKENALQAARELLSYGADTHGFHTFFGTYGVGKSGILKSAVAALVRIGVKCKYVRANEMLSMIRSTYGNDSSDSELSILRDFEGYQLMAIDEVDRVSTTDWGMSTLFAIIDSRYNLRKSRATLIATNQFPDKMGGEWGYLMSRMQDGHRIPVGGKSLRGYKHADIGNRNDV